MSPFLMGNMRAQKFKGKNSEVGLGEWKANLKVMFRMYKAPENTRVDPVINGLEGEAKRHILILPERGRSTVDQMFVL